MGYPAWAALLGIMIIMIVILIILLVILLLTLIAQTNEQGIAENLLGSLGLSLNVGI